MIAKRGPDFYKILEQGDYLPKVDPSGIDDALEAEINKRLMADDDDPNAVPLKIKTS